MILADTHTHTAFSTDSTSSPRSQIRQAIRLGLQDFYITDHYDMDFPGEEPSFVFDIPEYFRTLEALKEEYRGQICLHIGIELGLQPHLGKRPEELTASWPFEFVIGSTHVVDQMDPYFPVYWDGKTEQQGLHRYFEDMLENIRSFDCFDSCGHLDYIVRYLPSGRKVNLFAEFGDIIDEILRTLIDRDIALECNSAGFKYGLGHPNPHEDVLIRYRELGGELLTIGSDGHAPEHLAYDFSLLPELLKKLGYRYYTIYKDRRPVFLNLNE